jgi:hypothetical protein
VTFYDYKLDVTFPMQELLIYVQTKKTWHYPCKSYPITTINGRGAWRKSHPFYCRKGVALTCRTNTPFMVVNEEL